MFGGMLAAPVVAVAAIATSEVWLPALGAATLKGLPSGASDFAMQMTSNEGDIKKWNPISTLSATYLKSPFLAAIPGQFFNTSYNNLTQPKLSITDFTMTGKKALSIGYNALGNKFGDFMSSKRMLGAMDKEGELIGQMAGDIVPAMIDKYNEEK